MRRIERNLDALMLELDCISTTLSALAYSIEGGIAELDLTKTSAQEILFGCCNHLDRIIEDMQSLDD